MQLRFPLFLGFAIALSAFQFSAFAKDSTIDFGDAITIEGGHSYIQADALDMCVTIDKDIAARIQELGTKIPSLNPNADLAVVTKIERRALQKGPRRPTQTQYFCSASIRSNNPKFVLHHGIFKGKQDATCEGTFAKLSSERNMVFEQTSERKTLFTRRYLCKVNYVELLQR